MIPAIFACHAVPVTKAGGARSVALNFQRVEDNAFHLQALRKVDRLLLKTMRKTYQRISVFSQRKAHALS